MAIARYEDTATPGLAEIAVVVDPRWRRQGLASALIGMLAELARDRGYSHFTATYLAGNRDAEELIDQAGGRRQIAEGIAEAVVSLDAANRGMTGD